GGILYIVHEIFIHPQGLLPFVGYKPVMLIKFVIGVVYFRNIWFLFHVFCSRIQYFHSLSPFPLSLLKYFPPEAGFLLPVPPYRTFRTHLREPGLFLKFLLRSSLPPISPLYGASPAPHLRRNRVYK